MNMIMCSEPCEHQHDGCCGLQGAGAVTNSALSPCRYFTPKTGTQPYDGRGGRNSGAGRRRGPRSF